MRGKPGGGTKGLNLSKGRAGQGGRGNGKGVPEGAPFPTPPVGCMGMGKVGTGGGGIKGGGGPRKVGGGGIEGGMGI